MTERLRRLVLWIAVITLSIPFFLKGRDISRKRDDVAFLPGATSDIGSLTIQLRGNCVKTGCYRFDKGISVGTVINMTVPDIGSVFARNNIISQHLRSGDSVSINVLNNKHVEITIERMNVGQEMLLGIPLDPNRLTATDWESLPGVGPATARNIISYRQKNGDFKSVRDLKLVSGIGDSRMNQIEKILKKGLIY
jgi:competence protein ComEA